jgi:hypothetical protein
MSNPDEWAAMREFIITGLERMSHENRDAIEAGLSRFAEGMQEFAAGIQHYVETTTSRYPKLKDASGSLAERGWFISGYFGMSEFLGLGMQCETASVDELERYVADMYRSSIDEHMRDLIRDYPQRAFAIKPAVDAHNRGEYALSVPLFFTQAEGISFATINKYIFKNGKSKGDVDENIKDAAMLRLKAIKDSEDSVGVYGMTSKLVEIMWIPFAEPLPVAYGEKARESNKYDGLNRNTIMHGIALEEYATEENSLRAFSMLSHLGSLMHDLVQQEKDYPWMQKT